ncbi:hypothetical protein [Nonomuraea salmonea]|uniref:Zinc finger protein n=1 Tax=Nonomuraea salmonea TaxID=46181 RepID=A0ABV5P2L9_9ACTN
MSNVTLTGRTVHEPGTSRDHRGDVVRDAACHQAFGGVDAGRWQETDQPVNCRRCLRLVAAQPAEPPPWEELPLFPEVGSGDIPASSS